ncbi:hypothetical protein [Cupriavidus sp. H39]|uniref:hypothetical protein n=1 Tax=Cupriavidus sp. H39 TaxID=3401635 RepID=UPI003CFC1D66
MALLAAAAGAGADGAVGVVGVAGDVPVEVPGLAAAPAEVESPPPPPPHPASVMTRQANGTAASLMRAIFMGSPSADSSVVMVDGFEAPSMNPI